MAQEQPIQISVDIEWFVENILSLTILESGMGLPEFRVIFALFVADPNVFAFFNRVPSQ